MFLSLKKEKKNHCSNQAWETGKEIWHIHDTKC